MDVPMDGLGEYLARLEPCIGDRRTKRTLRGVVEGMIVSGSLRCTQIAAFSPCLPGRGERL